MGKRYIISRGGGRDLSPEVNEPSLKSGPTRGASGQPRPRTAPCQAEAQGGGRRGPGWRPRLLPSAAGPSGPGQPTQSSISAPSPP